MLILLATAFVVYSYFLLSTPVFSDAYNSATATSIVSSCTYDFWNSQTDVYLNNGLHLHYNGNIDLKEGLNYTITYRTDSYRILSWSINNEPEA
jgi:capsular polysaccharide biosynthesis protein